MQHERFPDDDLPTDSVVDANLLRRATTFDADFVVVGSGAAGAVAAHKLAESGYSVILCEEGPWVKTREFGSSVSGAFAQLMRDGGLQVLQGRAFMPMLQGRCVGGSTVINSAIAWRVPGDVFGEWERDHGLSHLNEATLDEHYAALERDLNVREVAPESLGESNRLFLEAASRSGVQASVMRRYDRGCKGSARCMQGCPTAAKQGMNVSYVPWALRLGARILTNAKVTRVDVRGRTAVGVLAKNGEGTPIEVKARRGVLVAASTVQTPNILRRSGLRASALGEHFQAHPGHGFGALFDRPIRMDFGATQGAESIAFRTSHRFKLETLAMPPELATARVPGVGRQLSERLAQLGNLGVWVVQFRSEGKGTVRESWMGKDKVTFSPTERDLERLRTAFENIATFMFEAGAKEVWPGIYGLPAVLSKRDDIKLLRDAPLDPRAYSFVATHLFGAARMGLDLRTSVVGPSFETHEVSRLFVIDSSVFPTNLGVNPQHAIMALSRKAAVDLAERARTMAAA
jgi:choline dehydrogenase-like flavoprotein